MLRVCAITRERPARLPAGPAGGRLELLACGPLVVVAEAGGGELAPTPEALARHDETVRRLAEQVDALLPARFGWLAPDAAALADLLEPHAERLREALELTAGREQMTLRVFGEPHVSAAAPEPAGAGAGTRYLLGKREAARRREQVPEIEPLRGALAALVRAERVQRSSGSRRSESGETPKLGGPPGPPDPPSLLVTVYHLVDRGGGVAYRAVVEEAAPRLEPARVTVSGPFAPYAFAPEGLR
jgi:hypothetical protein